jgi:hypothetical protein
MLESSPMAGVSVTMTYKRGGSGVARGCSLSVAPSSIVRTDISPRFLFQMGDHERRGFAKEGLSACLQRGWLGKTLPNAD